jgi:hypothetical protein
MATSKQLNIVQAQQVLGDATAALAVCQNSFEAADFLSTRLRTGNGMLELDAGVKSDFEDDIIRFGLLGLAYSGYVVAWERYRKIVNIALTNFTEASVIFGLDKYVILLVRVISKPLSIRQSQFMDVFRPILLVCECASQLDCTRPNHLLARTYLAGRRGLLRHRGRRRQSVQHDKPRLQEF